MAAPPLECGRSVSMDRNDYTKQYMLQQVSAADLEFFSIDGVDHLVVANFCKGPNCKYDPETLNPKPEFLTLNPEP